MTAVTDTYGHELALPGPFHTITQAKQTSKENGQHWFDADTMRFFRSRIAPGIIAGRVFVSSEQFISSDGVAEARRYTVRVLHDDGSVCDLSEFQEFATLAQARSFARKAVAQ